MPAEALTTSGPQIAGPRLKVAVLMGGVGQERDISIRSGNCVAEALAQAGLDVVTADIRPDNIKILNAPNIDVFFIALHGRFGEDGQLQQILDDRSLLYTGSGPRASRLAFDKWASKTAFDQAGIKTPAAVRFDAETKPGQLERQLAGLSDRYVVKPLRQGSTIGVSIVDDARSAVAAAQQCSSEFGDCMVEQFIAGREITVGVLEQHTLPIIEVKTKNGFYDYDAKYVDEQTQFLFDTIDEPAVRATIEAAALGCFNTLGCRDFARVDFILGHDGQAYVLEVNTIPGFTAHSLLPMAAAKAQISFSRLCVRIIEAALRRRSPLQTGDVGGSGARLAAVGDTEK